MSKQYTFEYGTFQMPPNARLNSKEVQDSLNGLGEEGWLVVHMASASEGTIMPGTTWTAVCVRQRPEPVKESAVAAVRTGADSVRG